MNEFELQNQGLIDGDKVNETDYLLGSDNPLDIPYNKNKNNYYYNQGKLKRTRNACVLYGNAASLGYLMDYKFTEKELLEIVDLAEKEYGWKEDRGMYISRGVDCVRNYWNTKYPDRKVKTFRMEVGDEDFAEALRNNHRVVVGYRTCNSYYYDSQDNGIIENLKHSSFKGGHCVSTIFGKVETIMNKEGILINDNYEGSKKFNTYYNNLIKKLKDEMLFFPSAFIYLKDTDMEDKIKANIDLENAKKFFDRGYTNGLNPRHAITREELWATLEVILEKNNMK